METIFYFKPIYRESNNEQYWCVTYTAEGDRKIKAQVVMSEFGEVRSTGYRNDMYNSGNYTTSALWRRILKAS